MQSRHLVLGILADVDAGKTTLTESILFHTGSIRKEGRVDHGDSFLDNDVQERERGITIFSKQALFSLGEKSFTLLDTPGHADFSAEMERTLSVLDYCVLVISAGDGLRSHVFTLWKLLKRYEVPAFIFVNKTDLPGWSREELLSSFREKLGGNFPDFEAGYESICEEAAACDEQLMEKYFENGTLDTEDISSLIMKREIFPVLFGSALKNEHITELLDTLERFTLLRDYGDTLSGRVFKISRDAKGERLTHIKLTGGRLKPKDSFAVNISGETQPGKADGQNGLNDGELFERAEQLRLYTGARFSSLNEAEAGMIIAVTGPQKTKAGASIGSEAPSELPLLVPMFSCTVIPPFDVNSNTLYRCLKELEEEIPELSVGLYQAGQLVSIRLMGAVQTDIIKRLLLDRYKIDVRFGENRIVYKETITTAAEGVGHFEPLKHYAEVHLLLEPGERGSGLSFECECSDEMLSRNFQRLIMTHLEEKKHVGVLTGSEITDISIKLIAGRSHEKHTEGGDFRQATYRAVRHGLMRGASKLLEPYYDFRLFVPNENIGRAMNDLQNMQAVFEGPAAEGDGAVLTGRAPVSLMQGYPAQLSSYTKGFGQISLEYGGYDSCHNAEEVIAAYGYDPELDLDNQTGSVFCSHGAGYYVPWYEVESYMHIPYLARTGAASDPGITREELDRYWEQMEKAIAAEEEEALFSKAAAEGAALAAKRSAGKAQKPDYMGAGLEADKELEAIFNRTFGSSSAESEKRNGRFHKKKELFKPAKQSGETEHVEIKPSSKEYLLVDGYNIIFAWKELKELSEIDINSARSALMDILSNYQGFKGMELILVFDAYRVKGGRRRIEKYHNIHVVYTEEAETADAYIEKTVHDLDRKHRVTVATSDGLEQIIIFGDGASRMPASELYEAVKLCNQDIGSICSHMNHKLSNPVISPD